MTICDGCNRLIVEAESPSSANGFADAQSKIWLVFRKHKHMDQQRAWRKTRHYCRECADGVPVLVNGAAPLCAPLNWPNCASGVWLFTNAPRLERLC